MTYLELLQALEHRLGYQHVPLNPCASSLKDIFDCSPVHHELMRRIIQALYHANACHKLTDPVSREACFEAIGPVRRETLKMPSTDIDAYHLMDDLCLALDEFFAVDPPPVTVDNKRSAEVIPLPTARQHRRN